MCLILFDFDVFDYNVFDYVFDYNVFDFDVFDSNVFDYNVFDSNVFDSNVFDSNVFDFACKLHLQMLFSFFLKMHREAIFLSLRGGGGGGGGVGLSCRMCHFSHIFLLYFNITPHTFITAYVDLEDLKQSKSEGEKERVPLLS